MPKASIRDVAQLASVSPTTVSLILNNKGDRFPKETINRVIAARDELGYIPNKNAQGLRGTQKTMIGILVPSLRNPFFADLMQSIQAHGGRDVDLIFQSAADDMVEESITALVERGVNGLIIARPIPHAEKVIQFVKRRGVVAVMLDQSEDLGLTDIVTTDESQGGRLVAELLAPQGHHKVALVRPSLLTHNMTQRITGFMQNWPHELITFETTLSKHGGLAVAEKINQAAVSAVFAVNDEMAIGILRGLANLGVRVPQDISVVGYDNTDYAEFVIPSLTTVTQPVWQLGQKALDLVIHRLENPKADLVTEMMAVKLVERESTKQIM